MAFADCWACGGEDWVNEDIAASESAVEIPGCGTFAEAPTDSGRVEGKFFCDPARTVDLIVDLERMPEGAEVTRESLVEAGLISARKGPAKVLANGDLSHAITVRGIRMSAGAREKIEAAGGRVEE